MQQFNLEFFLIAAPAVIFAGISKGGFGSGVAFVSAAILALVIEPGEALAIMLPLLMLIDLVTLRPIGAPGVLQTPRSLLWGAFLE